MDTRAVPRLSKWAFLLGDLVLVAVGGWVLLRQAESLTLGPTVLAAATVAVGAWLGVTPFLVEYRAAVRLAEAHGLATTVAQIQKLEQLGDHIRLATSQWQTVQDQAEQTVAAAGEIAERMMAEARNFAEFMQKANDAEKAHLRLEVDKARRAETEWLQILVRLFDHIYALYMAGVHSAQPNLRQQLANFQAACRDIVRRVGFVPLEAQPGEPFDEMKHQLLDPNGAPPPGACVAETIATGYSFQGRLLRPPVVRVTLPPRAETEPEGSPLPSEPEPAPAQPLQPGLDLGPAASKPGAQPPSASASPARDGSAAGEADRLESEPAG